MTIWMIVYISPVRLKRSSRSTPSRSCACFIISPYTFFYSPMPKKYRIIRTNLTFDHIKKKLLKIPRNMYFSKTMFESSSVRKWIEIECLCDQNAGVQCVIRQTDRQTDRKNKQRQTQHRVLISRDLALRKIALWMSKKLEKMTIFGN